jgi:phenylpropionate dioxygenase-like ring-hydroxylating dioxygenase large terminal subunit
LRAKTRQDPVRKLVAFRDSRGRVGLIDERCPHCTASLFVGGNQECGLRCVYHGWKFDIEGNCVDLPSEPWDKDFKRKIKTIAYPCIESGGLVWAYMGPPEKKPEFPDLEWTTVPPSHRYVTRHIMDCNWLQAVEGGFDTSHVAFLHQGTVPPFKIERRYEAIATDFGFIAATARAAGLNRAGHTPPCRASTCPAAWAGALAQRKIA